MEDFGGSAVPNIFPLYVLKHRTVEGGPVSRHTYMLANYLYTVPDYPCLPVFNNSLDHGDCLRWRTPRDGLAGN